MLAISHLTYLLELINTDNYLLSFLYGNLFSHLKHFFWRMRLRCYTQRNSKITIRFWTE